MTATHPVPFSDQELMRRVQADDTEAFGLLFRRLAPAALRIARTVATDEASAHDAVQDGFLSVWHARRQYGSDRGEVHSWIARIVHNRAIDGTRRTTRHELRRSALELAADRPDAACDLQAHAVAADEGRRLRALLLELPAPQREVLTLAYFGELSHSEIAARLGVPLGTVKGRVRHGLSTLRGRLQAAA